MMPETEPLFGVSEAGPRKPALLPLTAEEAAIADAVAERVAARLAEGMLSLPAGVRQMLRDLEKQPGGYWGTTLRLGFGSNQFDMRVFMNPNGMEISILNPAGDKIWAVHVV